jgi:hypothetical protein
MIFNFLEPSVSSSLSTPKRTPKKRAPSKSPRKSIRAADKEIEVLQGDVCVTKDYFFRFLSCIFLIYSRTQNLLILFQ